jgi:Uma2 family endonuclease
VRLRYTALSHFISGPFDFNDEPGGWWIMVEPEFHLHGNVLVPDLAGWRRERMPTMPDTVGIESAPDWACEIALPSTAHIDRTRKMSVYAGEGVEWLWLVDPVGHTLETFRRVERTWLQHQRFDDGGPELIRAEPFDAVELESDRWWLPESAPPAAPPRG